MRNISVLALAVMLLTACGTQKAALSNNGKATDVTKTTAVKDDNKAQLDFLDKVNSNASYQKNISANIVFKASQDGGKEISVPGQLRMRKDEVVRISLQVPLIGTEVGRLEFTKDYVLIMDRIHKQYVKAKYDQVGFLRDNGITFYSLQALFWNKLLLPGKTTVGYTDLDKFTTNLNGSGNQIPITLKDGKLTYTWTAERSNGVIDKTQIEYGSHNHGTSTLTWSYSNFQNFGSKPFPYINEMTIVTPANGKTKTLKTSYEINRISTASDWDATTTISDKYKQVSVEEVLGKLTKD